MGADGELVKALPFREADPESIAAALEAMPETCVLDVAGTSDRPTPTTSMRVAELMAGGRKRKQRHRVQVERVIASAGEKLRLGGHDFEEREHPEDFYIRYSNMGADELAEVTAMLRARARKKP